MSTTGTGRGRYPFRDGTPAVCAYRIPIVATPELSKNWADAACKYGFDSKSDFVRQAVEYFISYLSNKEDDE